MVDRKVAQHTLAASPAKPDAAAATAQQFDVVVWTSHVNVGIPRRAEMAVARIKSLRKMPLR